MRNLRTLLARPTGRCRAPLALRRASSFVVLALVAALGLGGCAEETPNGQSAPESAFRAFRVALASGNSEALWSFLGPETRGWLEERAAESPDAARGNPANLLVAAWVPSEAEIDTLERLRFEDDVAVLEMTTVLGHRSEITMTRTESGWRIELPEPAAPPDAAPAAAPAAAAAQELDPAAVVAPDPVENAHE